MDDHPHDHDEGLARDLETLGRRRVLLGGAGLAAATLLTAWGCGGGTTSTTTTTADSGSTTTGGTTTAGGSTGSCAVSAEETEGPYPADGSNTVGGSVVDVLSQTGIVRSDITTSFGSYSGTAAGVPVRIVLTLEDVAGSCAALSGYAIYVWHCDRDGRYSLYTATNRNYLRGVQPTDADGVATFTSIFPACYAGRMPHIHVEVYRSEATASSYVDKLKTTQIALPVDVCEAVYTTADGYSASVANLADTSFATDMVFADGTSTEMATVTGSVADGYTIALTLGIRA